MLTGRMAWRASIVSFALIVAGCDQVGNSSDEEGVTNGARSSRTEPLAPVRKAPKPKPHVVPAVPELRAWLIGAWSYDPDCATDFAVRFMADGKLSDAGEGGTWDIAGDQVTTTITERYEMGDEVVERVNPPVTTRYRIERIDQQHGIIHVGGRPVPILRC